MGWVSLLWVWFWHGPQAMFLSQSSYPCLGFDPNVPRDPASLGS